MSGRASTVPTLPMAPIATRSVSAMADGQNTFLSRFNVVPPCVRTDGVLCSLHGSPGVAGVALVLESLCVALGRDCCCDAEGLFSNTEHPGISGCSPPLDNEFITDSLRASRGYNAGWAKKVNDPYRRKMGILGGGGAGASGVRRRRRGERKASSCHPGPQRGVWPSSTTC